MPAVPDRATAILASLRLAASVLGYAVAGAIGGMAACWVPTYVDSRLAFFDVNLTAHEPVIVPPYLNMADTVFGRVLLDIQSVGHLFLFSIMFAMVLRLSAKQRGAIFLATVTGFVLMKCLPRGYDFLVITFPTLCGVITLRLFLAPDNYVLRIAAWLGLAVMLSFLLPVAIIVMPQDTDGKRLLMVTIIFPLIREAQFFLVRSVSRVITLEANIAGSGVHIFRDRTYGFFLWQQIGVAMATRLFFTSLDSRTSLAFAVLYQSAFEIASRLTLEWRDEHTSFRSLRCCGISRPASQVRALPAIVRMSTILETTALRQQRCSYLAAKEHTKPPQPPMPSEAWGGDAPTTAHGERSGERFDPAEEVITSPDVQGPQLRLALDEDEVRHSRQTFHSMLICGEMLSEYTAIFSTAAVLLLFRDRPLRMGFDMHARAQGPAEIDFDANLRDVLFGFCSQLVAELGVDTLCGYVELRRGYPLFTIWMRRCRFFLVFYILSAWMAMNGMWVFLFQRDQVMACKTRDLCECIDLLSYPGARRAYCLYIYNETGGRPPG